MGLRDKISKIRGFIRKPYYYVPPCPQCGSRATGRYVRDSSSSDWVIEESLRHGELVRPAKGKENVAFCLDCNYEWFEYIQMEWFTHEEIQEEKIARMTEPILQELKQERRAERKKEKGGLFNYKKFNGKF
jgi:hypothetical protein